tara:strand:- start:262 stop:822 length:561 start_codon:yes stop_codon:yes gene_type:complete
MSYLKLSTEELMEKLEEGQELEEQIPPDSFSLDKMKIDIKTLKKMKQTLEKKGGYNDDLSFIEFPNVGQTKQLNFQIAYDILKQDTTKAMSIYREQQFIEEEKDKFGKEESSIINELQLRHKKEIKKLKPKIAEFKEAKEWYKNMEEEKTSDQVKERRFVVKELDIMKNKKKEFKNILKYLEEMKK